MKRALKKARTPKEPSVEESHLEIAVRHPVIGTVRRRFPPSSQMTSVYDWAGSLSASPEHFKLKLSYTHPEVQWISPSSPITAASNNVLDMIGCDEPPPLTDDDPEVSFLGYVPVQEETAAGNDTLPIQQGFENDFEKLSDYPLQLLQYEEDASALETGSQNEGTKDITHEQV